MIDRTLNYGRHHIREFFARSMPFTTALDIGAGSGTDLLLAREVNPTAKLIAIESFPENVEHLRGLGVAVHSLNVERDRFPVEDASVDVVVMNQVLEHLKEVFWVLHEVSRVLRPGGHLVIGVPNLASLHNRILLALGRQPSPIKNNSAHVRGFTRGDVMALLASGFPGGYELRDFGGSNFYPLPGQLAQPLARALPTFAWGIFFRFEKMRTYQREFVDYPRDQRLETNFYLGS